MTLSIVTHKIGKIGDGTLQSSLNFTNSEVDYNMCNPNRFKIHLKQNITTFRQTGHFSSAKLVSLSSDWLRDYRHHFTGLVLCNENERHKEQSQNTFTIRIFQSEYKQAYWQKEGGKFTFKRADKFYKIALCLP